MAKNLNTGDISGCLEVIGICNEVENEIKEVMQQWAQEEWCCKFEDVFSFDAESFEKKYGLNKEESKRYVAKEIMPESFTDKFRRNCASYILSRNMNKDERFLWHKRNPNTQYFTIRGIREKKLYKVKCNICNRIFFMDAESFTAIKWQSCVGAKCLKCAVNEDGIDYSKSLYSWDTDKNELIEIDAQLTNAEELSTAFTYYSAGNQDNILKIAYISDIHLQHHLKFYKNDVKKMVRNIAKNLYQSRSSADIIIFNGDISSEIDLTTMFFKQFVREYDYEALQLFKKKLNHLKILKKKLNETISKYIQRCDNFSKYIEKMKWDLKDVLDFAIFEKYKERYYPDISYETAYEYYRKTKNFKNNKISEYMERKIWDVVRLIDLQVRYNHNIAYYERQKQSDQYKIDCFEMKYRKSVEEISLKDYKHITLNDSIHEKIFLILGNHEYIGFPDILASVKSYKAILSTVGIKVLHNEYVETDKYVLYGGTGFAKYDNVWNADNIICCDNFTREDELKETSVFENRYKEALGYAKEKGLCFLCVSHYPVPACLGMYDKEAIYFTGHNHRNEYMKNEEHVLYADNQIGYVNNNIAFKIATTGFEINPYSELGEGLYQTTVEDYLKFYRYVGENVGEGQLLYKRCQHGKLYVVKRKGYYGFFIVSTQKDSKGISIVNGGATKKLTRSTDISWICENFDIVVKKYLQMLLPLRNAQEELSKELKEIGLDGTIHGLIVDVDFYHHIAVNPVEGSLIFYYSSIWGMVLKLNSFEEVIKSLEYRATLGDQYDYKSIMNKYKENIGRTDYLLNMLSDDCLLEIEYDEMGDTEENLCEVEQMVSRTDGIYGVSRKISPLQRLFSGRVLRDFDLRLTETKQQSYRKVLYTDRVFMYEGIRYQVVEDDGSDMIIAEELEKGPRTKGRAIKLTGKKRRFSITALKSKIKRQSEDDTYWISK